MDWTSIICAVVALLGTAIGSYSGLRLTSYRVEQLEKKVDKHNRFAERVPIMEEQIKVINHRISDLEHLEHLAGGEPR
ncbi:MAG: hypothetical protein SPG37_04310 [Eubacteriales bacterium]|uniref:Hemolysin XhlA n=1 Tax=Myoviridae sp. ctRPH1 TaxID=2826650 RepID=A0A8S5MAE2_9CAUD|nr:hypothetical protein [Eubacteriales bacterium]DAD79277.1 MAG TPA: hemolysin XhlA [Myoviridae sp. ctRPH1]